MMTMMEAVATRKLVRLAAALLLALFTMGCATSQGPLSSHGVDHVPPFEATANTG